MSSWNQTSSRSRNSRTTAAGSGSDFANSTLLKAVDFGIGAIIFVGPFMLGGRHPMGRFVILTLCVLTALAWFWRQTLIGPSRVVRSATFGLLLASIALVMLQLVPLPANWLEKIAPRISQILPLWTTEQANALHLGQWQTVSLAPEETRLALATLIGYALLFITTVQRISTIEDITRLMKWVGTSAVIVATFGIVQYFTSNGKFLWFFEYGYTNTFNQVKGCFTSRNHFAHFLVLGLANLVAWNLLVRHESKGRRRSVRRNSFVAIQEPSNKFLTASLTVGLTIVVFAVLASLSRGGILALGAATAVVAVIYARARILNSSHLIAGVGLVVVMMAALSFSGNYEHVAQRMDTLTSRSINELDGHHGRRKIWAANVAAFKAGILTGSGAGSHRYIYPLYMSDPSTTEYTHAENGYLQIATENGLVGITLLIAILGTMLVVCGRAIRNAVDDRQMQIVAGGLAAALVASLTHSIVDFVWFIPACMSVTILIAACVIRLAQLTALSAKGAAFEIQLTKLSGFNRALAASLAGIWALVTLFPLAKSSLEWDHYHIANEAVRHSSERKLFAGPTEIDNLTEAQEMNSESQILHLTNVVRDYPNSALAHSRLASTLLNRFEVLQQQSENSMPVNQIRATVQDNQFKSAKELREWLQIAFGDNSRLLYQAFYHARRAVELCPLQGESYLQLAELSFLTGRGVDAFEALTKQSLLVRPYDVDVLYAVGKNQLIAHQNDEALQTWSTAFRTQGKHQFEIIGILSGHMTAENFLRLFSPGWNTLETIWINYKLKGNLDELETIAAYAAVAAKQEVPNVTPFTSGRIWLGLARMQFDMQDPKSAFASLSAAYEASPGSFAIRYELGKCLLRFEQFEAAESHLRWCYNQYPDNPTVKKELQLAIRGKLQRLAQSTNFPAIR
jgi:O-antigen ligase/tetratricopeptide (TPR) repeat protein